MCLLSTVADDKKVEVERPPGVSAEDMEDALYEHGASLELVREWALREERVFRAVCLGKPLQYHLRAAALAFLSWLAKGMQIPSPAFFSAVALVDEYSKRTPGGLSAEQLPRACAAAVNVEKKMDDSRSAVQSGCLAALATQFSLRLRQMGHNTPEKITKEQLEKEERLLLDALEWQVIGVPTLESWLALFVKRLNVFTWGRHAQQLNRASQRTLLCGWALVSHVPWSMERPPRTMAQGLLAMALAAEGLLPEEDCRAAAEELGQDARAAFCAATCASWADVCASRDLAAAAVQETALASMGKAGATA